MYLYITLIFSLSTEAEVNEQDNDGDTPLHLTLGGQQRQLPGVRTLFYLRTRPLKQYTIGHELQLHYVLCTLPTIYNRVHNEKKISYKVMSIINKRKLNRTNRNTAYFSMFSFFTLSVPYKYAVLTANRSKQGKKRFKIIVFFTINRCISQSEYYYIHMYY